MKRKWYAGKVRGSLRWEAFSSETTPTAETHGDKYGFIVGSMSKRAALWMQDNPCCWFYNIAQLEQLAKS